MFEKRALKIPFLSSFVLMLALALGPLSARGDVTYTLHFDPASSAQAQQVADSVAEAVPIINQYGSFNKHWNVYYNAGIPTAEGNYDGYIGCGGTRNTRVIFHEGAHTFGMGTYGDYFTLIAGGVWGGAYGNQAQFDTYNDYTDGLHGDNHAIWPGGFNYDNEDGFIERIWMLRIMAGIRCDMGILAYSKEAENELAHPGETAAFHVESPVAATYQWYKGAAALSNGGDIAGATSPTLRIANAEAGDEGSYHCAVTGAGETLNSRPRQLFVAPAQLTGQWNMDGDVTDSANTNNGTAYGSPAYAADMLGQPNSALDLDGVNDYVSLPAAVGLAKDITVATWVNWDGGSNWQRIFDFGTGIYQHMFLTPKSDSNMMRLSFVDAINGSSTEQAVEAAVLPIGQWVHLAAVLNNGYATLYVNGEAVGTTPVSVTNPIDFLPTQNYIGRSQFAGAPYYDPYFNGQIDDFQVYNYALDGPQVWDLWGQSANAAPVFSTNLVVLPPATGGQAYYAESLTNYVYDADGDTLNFEKIDGPAWLIISANGELSGTAGSAAAGTNSFYVRVVDPSGASSDAELQIYVAADFRSGPVAYWDFNDAALGASDGAALPDSDGYSLWRKAAADKSGNGNDLTTWEHDWAGFNWSANSQQGDFSIHAAGGYPAAYTWSSQSLPSGDAETIALTNFTVEALFTCTGSGVRTVLGRDGRYLSTIAPDNAALYLSVDSNQRPLFVFTDVNGSRVRLTSLDSIPNDNTTWTHLAGVSDGSTVSLYLNGTLIASENTAMGAVAAGTANGADWHAGGWSVGRGLRAGAHSDRWFGYIDAVAISGVALTPDHFVITGTWPTGYDFFAEDYGIPGEPFGGDWNSNGIPNGMEYYLGYNPTSTSPPPSILTWTNNFLSAVHPFDPSAYGVTGSVEWTSDLTSNDWSSAGISYSTNWGLGEIEATFGTETTNQLFIRLKVSE